MSENIRVAVRVRPFNGRERDLGCDSIVEVRSGREVRVSDPEEDKEPRVYTFDFAYDDESTQEVSKPLSIYAIFSPTFFGASPLICLLVYSECMSSWIGRVHGPGSAGGGQSAGWLQRDHLRLRADGVRQDAHDDGLA
eukprot:scaffold486_cov254-Pinguiococcus_pyrenoidosus.AAC.9